MTAEFIPIYVLYFLCRGNPLATPADNYPICTSGYEYTYMYHDEDKCQSEGKRMQPWIGKGMPWACKEEHALVCDHFTNATSSYIEGQPLVDTCK